MTLKRKYTTKVTKGMLYVHIGPRGDHVNSPAAQFCVDAYNTIQYTCIYAHNRSHKYAHIYENCYEFT